MEVISNPQAAYAQLAHWRREGSRIGLVPTMGALHAGHISLVERGRADCDFIVSTIFVNPTQFGPNEDFTRYPRTLEADLQMLRAAGCDLVFTPAVEAMYPPGDSTAVLPPRVSHELEGQFRPGHFQGVATIVLKLFNLLPATIAYFGQKDYQQCQVIKQMVDQLNVPIRIEVCPTVREADGLAMSSRNRYLTAEQRQRALCLWKALQAAQTAWLGQGRDLSPARCQAIERQMHEVLLREGADVVDYARIVDRETLLPPSESEAAANGLVALIAVRVGTTRLIDNLLLEPASAQYSVLHSA